MLPGMAIRADVHHTNDEEIGDTIHLNVVAFEKWSFSMLYGEHMYFSSSILNDSSILPFISIIISFIFLTYYFDSQIILITKRTRNVWVIFCHELEFIEKVSDPKIDNICKRYRNKPENCAKWAKQELEKLCFICLILTVFHYSYFYCYWIYNYCILKQWKCFLRCFIYFHYEYVLQQNYIQSPQSNKSSWISETKTSVPLITYLLNCAANLNSAFRCVRLHACLLRWTGNIEVQMYE